MKYQITFRADASHEIGMGHLTRCLALSQMLKDHFDIQFVTMSPSGKIRDEIGMATSRIIIMDEKPEEDEAIYLCEILDPQKDILVLDSYTYGEQYLRILKKSGLKLVVIDDLAALPVVSDVLVNHSPGINQTDYLTEGKPVFCLGPAFALLRPAFLKAATQTRERLQINSVLICFGGSDPENITNKVLRLILQYETIGSINVVVGGAYQNEKELSEISHNLGSKINIHQGLDQQGMVSLIQSNDLAICSASTISMEACMARIPLCCGLTADNQQRLLKGLISIGCCFSIGDFRSIEIKELEERFSGFLSGNSWKSHVRNQMTHFDGKSAERFRQVFSSLSYA